MPYDFSGDAGVIIAELGNAGVVVGGADPRRGIYGAPTKLIPSFDLSVGSTGPTLVLTWDAVQSLGIDSGSALTVTPDRGAAIDYLVSGPPQHDGAGLAQINLQEA